MWKGETVKLFALVVLTCLALFTGGPPTSTASPAPEVSGLTANGRVNPLGIPGAAPALGWRTSSSRRATTQTAYEIRVGSAARKADVWRTGKVRSAQQVDVSYGGPALASATRYHWQVRIWDDQGVPSGWSAPAWFETGLLSPSDWGSAAWIGKPSPTYGQWTDYTATVRFRLNNEAFGTFLRAKDANNAYMWQLNVGTSANAVPMLRPHLRLNGNYSVLAEIDLRPFGFTRAGLLAGTHTVAYTVEGGTVRTVLDGIAVDSRTVSDFPVGRPGLRTFDKESVTVTSFTATKPDGTALADTELAVPNPFTGGSLGDHELTVTGSTDALLDGREAYEPLLRTTFRTAQGKKVAQARIYASAHGVYELTLNGRKVGDQFLAPGYTEYAKRIQSQTYDVTGLVRAGANGFGAALGDGWWAGKVGLAGKAQYGTDLSVIARLKITYTDGRVQWVDTTPDWRWHAGPFAATDNQIGETYDARLEQPGWADGGFDDASWQPVVQRSSEVSPTPQPDEPVRQTEVLRTVAVTKPAGGATIYDLGQNMVGVARVKITGKAGDTIRVRHAEVLNRDGTMYVENLRAATATDHYRFGRDGTITYQPTFTQHGFRYVEITGARTAPAAADVQGVVWGSDLRRTGTLRTSDGMLNQLHSNVTWGARGNFLSIPTDTPARDERLGWTGDISIFAPTASYLSDMRAFLGKWMTDVRDEQKASGSIPAVVPSTNGAFDESGVGWDDAIITVPYALWHAYADTQVLRDNYEAMSRFFAYARASAGPDNLETGRLTFFTGDWLNLDDPSHQGVLGTAIWAQDVRMMAEMAKALGRDAEAAEYSRLHEDVRTAFTNAYVAADGTVLGNSQTGYALALGMDLITGQDLKARAGAKYVAKLAQSDNHLRTGFIGTPWLLPALSGIGRDDLAYTLLSKKDYPSWGYEIEKGATTIWERWNSIQPDGSFGPVDMNSFNHYAYGAVADWMHQNIAGIRIKEAGYRKSVIEPHLGGGLTHAEGSIDTVYGKLSNAWSLNGTTLTMTVTVPAGTTAEIVIPAADAGVVTESGRPLRGAAGVLGVVQDPAGKVTVTAGSGRYVFTARIPA
jgi:alpha-L-rhamnosidase